MTEIVAAHLERVAKELATRWWNRIRDENDLFDPRDLEQAVAAALAACAREASEKLKPYCRHLNSCAAFPARSEQQIKRDCDCGLAAMERAVGEKA